MDKISFAITGFLSTVPVFKESMLAMDFVFIWPAYVGSSKNPHNLSKARAILTLSENKGKYDNWRAGTMLFVKGSLAKNGLDWYLDCTEALKLGQTENWKQAVGILRKSDNLSNRAEVSVGICGKPYVYQREENGIAVKACRFASSLNGLPGPLMFSFDNAVSESIERMEQGRTLHAAGYLAASKETGTLEVGLLSLSNTISKQV